MGRPRGGTIGGEGDPNGPLMVTASAGIVAASQFPGVGGHLALHHPSRPAALSPPTPPALVAGAGVATVLIADERMLIRAGLRAVIESDPSLRVVAEAADGRAALELARRIGPSIALLAARTRALDGIAVTRELHAGCPDTAVILIASEADGDLLLEGLRAGALGFVGTDVSRSGLLRMIRRALAGESAVDPAVATSLVVRMAAAPEHAGRQAPDALTARELEILRLVAEGQTNREIAAGLIVAVGTIKAHVEHILGKLGVVDRTQAAVRGVELGLVPQVLNSVTHGDDREE